MCPGWKDPVVSEPAPGSAALEPNNVNCYEYAYLYGAKERAVVVGT